MNWLQRLLIGKKLASELETKSYSPLQPNVRYQFVNGRLITSADDQNSFIQNGYDKNDIIYAVINLMLNKIRLPEWHIFQVVDEQKHLQYRRLQSQIGMLTGKQNKQMALLKEQSLEPIPAYNMQQGKIADLLKYPNEQCTWQDLVTLGMLFKYITGNDYLYGDLLSMGGNSGIPNAIWNLPSQHMQIKVQDYSFPPQVAAYTIFLWNQYFTPQEILHDKFENPNWDINGQQLYGMSPLKAALKNTDRNNSAKDASTAQFQNGGLRGIVYFDDQATGYNPKEALDQMNALKIKLSEEYSGPDATGKIAASGYKTGYIPLGLSPVDLALIDSEKWDAQMFCNIYGVPPELLGLVSKTFNNMKEAEKALTTRTAIPHLTSLRNQINRKLTGNGDWGFKGQNVWVDYDTDCFPELHTDINTVLEATSKMQFITPNEERDAAGWDARPEPEANEIWVLQNGNRVPLKDFQAGMVDQQLISDMIAGQQQQPQPVANGQQQQSANGNGKFHSVTKN